MKLLDPSLRSDAVLEFESALRQRIVGQNESVAHLTDAFQNFTSGLTSPRRPIKNLLFLGPTGVGKTAAVEATADVIFSDPGAFVKINCAEFQHSHEIAKIIGSPPGYLGHRETHPRLSQHAINQWHTEKIKLSIVLFDEIEKAHEALWQLLLGILDKAELTLGDNTTVNFSRSIVVMTSNIGVSQMHDLLSGGMGFRAVSNETDTGLDKKIDSTAREAARKRFSPEFMNRLDSVVVFHNLRDEEMAQILDIELDQVRKRLALVYPFVLRVSDSMKRFLLKDGTSFKYGARHLKRSIEKTIVSPISNLVSTKQISQGDIILVDTDDDKVVFVKEAFGPFTVPDLQTQVSAAPLLEPTLSVPIPEAGQAAAANPPQGKAEWWFGTRTR